MTSRKILALSWVLLLFSVSEVVGEDGGRCTTQPNELAVDICVYMTLPVPPAREAEETGRGPGLISKLKGFTGAWRNGKMGEWVTQNPPRVVTVSATPSHVGQTPRYGLVVLLPFGRGGESRPVPTRLAAHETSEPGSSPELVFETNISRRGPNESVREDEREGILEGSLALERGSSERDRQARRPGASRQYALGNHTIP